MVSKEGIENGVGTDLYSIQVYDELAHFKKFNPNVEFTKWAAVEVKNYINIPNGIASFTIKKGLYAVFVHKGSSTEFSNTFQYILGQWLPQSEFELDNRPHFEVLGEKYKNNNPSSEEEVWIPIRTKALL